MTVRAAGSRLPSYVWRDRENHTVGVGFRASEQSKNVKLDANALGGSVKWGPTGAAVSAEVVRLKVSGTMANGAVSGSVSAQALTASAKFGKEGDLAGKKVNGNGKISSSGPTMYGVGAEAHVAKTTVSGGFKVGPVKVEVSGSVGFGASASLEAGFSKKGFGLKAEAGAGATVGGALKVTWDTDVVDRAIAKASVPSRRAPSSHRSHSWHENTISPD